MGQQLRQRRSISTVCFITGIFQLNMLSVLLTVSLFTVVLTVSRAPIINCTNASITTDAVKQCSAAYGITLNVPTRLSEGNLTEDMLPHLILTNLTASCSPLNLPKYKQAAKCSANITRQCTAVIANGTSVQDQFLPTDSQIDSAYDYLCAHEKDFNETCATLTSTQKAIENCILLKTQNEVTGKNATETTCMGINMAVHCANESTSKCGKTTSVTYAETLKFLLPHSCAAYQHKYSSTAHTTLSVGLVTDTVAMETNIPTSEHVILPTASTVDCTNVSDYKNCFNDKNQNPILTMLRGKITQGSGGLTLSKRFATWNYGSICRHAVSSFSTTLDCLMNISRSCAVQFKTLLPSEDNVMDTLTYVCDNIQNINIFCLVNSKMATSSTCVTKKITGELRTLITEDAISEGCAAISNGIQCLSDQIESCGQSTKHVYNEVVRRLSPKVCSASSVSNKCISDRLLVLVAILVACVSTMVH